MSKKYGLIKTDKSKNALSILSDGDDNDDNELSVRGSCLRPTGLRQSEILKAMDKKVQQKVLEEDPSVYMYDEIYDQIVEEKVKSSTLLGPEKNVHQKPKYIQRMLETAEQRKKEFERRLERKIQKEREAEGDEFKDKEKFVTLAYRKKLEELREFDDIEKRQDFLESVGDVTKQPNVDGFYRHLYDQQVNLKPETKDMAQKPKKNFRKQRNISSSDSEPEPEPAQERKKGSYETNDKFGDNEPEDVEANKEPEEIPISLGEMEVVAPDNIVLKPKSDIWKKRTVGEVFDEALKRYFERKSIQNQV